MPSLSRFFSGEYWYRAPDDWLDMTQAERATREAARDKHKKQMANMRHPVPRPDETGPKRRPPPATPVTLPVYSVKPFDWSRIQGFTPADINAGVVQTPVGRWAVGQHRLLGVELSNGTYIEDMVPTSYIPPKAWEEKPAPEQSEQREFDTSAPSTEALSNGASVPGHEAFYVRVTELKYSRNEALAALARKKTPDGRPAPRLSHFRKFWSALDNVSTYWDTSKDEYGPEGEAEFVVGRSVPEQAPANEQVLRQQTVNLAIGASPSTATVSAGASGPGVTALPEIRDYYGVRTSDGRSMSNDFRRELVRQFIDPIIHTMGCHYNDHKQNGQQVHREARIQNAAFRLDISGLIFRGPKERMLARQGWNEGPVVAVSCRSGVNYTQFVTPEEALANEKWMERIRHAHLDPVLVMEQLCNPDTRARVTAGLAELDFRVSDDKEPRILMWSGLDLNDTSVEIGALLMLAQQRARNCRNDEEVRPGTGKWWAENPRFGGHPDAGQEVGKPLLNDDLSPVIKDESQPISESQEMDIGQVGENDRGRTEDIEPVDPAVANIAVSPSRMAANKRQRRDSGQKQQKKEAKLDLIIKARKYNSRRPPKMTMDIRTNYLRVGMGPEQDFEHVYLISSVIHHVSILRLRIHPSMLAYLANWEPNSGVDVARPPRAHYGLHVSRTRWFDMLKAEDRTEATRAIWGVMAYMMRSTDTERPEDRAFARRLSRLGYFADV